ncbi:MAG: hypothetical protein CM15mP58_05160 [Burkholderiaceae bacterium]|nr:MAG: hypothetical protein CM15mP58_05160 [Burkholderiaceae bacterium]
MASRTSKSVQLYATPNSPEPFPILQVDEPTLGVNFFVNSSPFAGKRRKIYHG